MQNSYININIISLNIFFTCWCSQPLVSYSCGFFCFMCLSLSSQRFTYLPFQLCLTWRVQKALIHSLHSLHNIPCTYKCIKCWVATVVRQWQKQMFLRSLTSQNIIPIMKLQFEIQIMKVQWWNSNNESQIMKFKWWKSNNKIHYWNLYPQISIINFKLWNSMMKFKWWISNNEIQIMKFVSPKSINFNLWNSNNEILIMKLQWRNFKKGIPFP